MKRTLLFLVLSFILLGCDSNQEIINGKEKDIVSDATKQDKMLDSGVNLYLNQMTAKYTSAFTVSITEEDKMKYLNEAITDINLAVLEIEDEYEEGAPPTDELFKLADLLLLNIEQVMTGEESYSTARDAGEIIGDLSREYLDGELPIGIQLMIEQVD